MRSPQGPRSLYLLLCEANENYLRLLSVHREEGRVKLVKAWEFASPWRQALKSHGPPPVIGCDHVLSMHQVAPELRGPIGFWEPARQANDVRHPAYCCSLQHLYSQHCKSPIGLLVCAFIRSHRRAVRLQTSAAPRWAGVAAATGYARASSSKRP